MTMHAEWVSIASSTTTLILLPGFDGTGKLFCRFESELKCGCAARVVRYENELSVDEYVDTAAKAVPESGAILLAESFSGPIALELMVRFPARIAGAVLCATFAVAPFRALAMVGGLLPTAAFAYRSAQRALLSTFCLNGVSDAALSDEALSVLQSVSPTAIKHRLTALARMDMRPLRGRIQQPVLILEAAHDRLLGAQIRRALRELLPHATVRRIDGPHLLLQSRPAACATAVDEFVDALRGNA